jgi:hypothetical protein
MEFLLFEVLFWIMAWHGNIPAILGCLRTKITALPGKAWRLF